MPKASLLAVYSALKTHRDMALGAEVIDLIGLHLLDDPDQVGAVGEVSVVENKSRIAFMWILIEVINPAGVEAASPPLDAMHLVTLIQQEFRQIAAILTGDASDQSGFRKC